MESKGFCASLTRARNNAGLSKTQLASRIGRAVSTVTRWERGEHLPERDDAELLDRELRCDGDLLRDWQVAATGSVVPHWKQRVPWLEQNSVTIKMSGLQRVPGLVQSREYMRFIFRVGRFRETEEELEREVNERAARYDALSANGGPWIVAAFPITALTCLPDAVRADQASHLIEQTERGRLSVHLLAADAVTGLVSPLLLFSLREGGVVAASEHNRGVVVHDDPAGIGRMANLFEQTLGAAMPAADSRSHLKGMT
ncbi:helix-turn-helix domain-containing protein [Nocardiopsis lucentensis]|uniref:helix-turn-helix domain-containing protein n=1 Tax=Nocardiopsis lucentensis TaxID=53441 RepID=UPI00034DA54D|nr:Scr1 family TA system antitoxin-like transcriptional regulator [Nocardiopsis lucentensis]